jgi:hypothetical protein
MICLPKPGLTEDSYVRSAKGRIFNDSAICAIRTLEERPSILITDKSIFSSERMLHKDYYRKSSVEKETLVVILKGLDIKTN